MFGKVKLGEICTFSRGLTYSKKDEVVHSENGVLRATNIDLSNNMLTLEDIRYISDSVEVKDEKRVSKGDILVCTASGSKAHLGKVALVKEDLGMAFGGFMAAIRPIQTCLPEYLFLVLISEDFKVHLRSISDGANINNLKFSQIENFEIPLPPITEQQRIVAILDQAFADIEKARANAEKNLKNARELFDSYLNQVFTGGSGFKMASNNWVQVVLEQAVDSFTIGLVKSSREQDIGHKYTYIKMNNIANDNSFNLSKTTSVNASEEEIKKYALDDNDFLFNTRNSVELVGKSCLYRSFTQSPVLFNNNIARIRFKDEIIPAYAAYAFCSPFIKEQLESMKQGTTNVAAIYYKSLKKLKLRHPSTSNQQLIVSKLDSLKAKTTLLEKGYQEKLNSLEELKKSLLQKAFSGELTKTEGHAA